MQTSSMRAYDEPSLDYFESEVLSRADLVYRFGFALTGSPDQAKALLQQTFETVAKEFTKFVHIRDFNMVAYLLAECWRVYMSGSRGEYHQSGDEASRLVGELPTESRVALFAIEVAGLAAADAAKVFGTTEKVMRVKLASARRALLSAASDV